jgi:pimeloyl-ACP methyl ester carboxylesterase
MMESRIGGAQSLEKSFMLPMKNGYKLYTREIFHNSISKGGEKSSVVTIAVHGGPGVGDSSESFQGLKGLLSTNVVFYDQLGCGKSDKPDDMNLYTLHGYVQQLKEVVEYCRREYEIVGVLGHSWGGQVLLQWLLNEGDSVPIGFSIVSNSPLDEQHYEQHQRDLRNRLDEDVRAFYEEQDDILAKDTTIGSCIYQKLIGGSELHISGEMKGWSILDRITGNDSLPVPCLFLVTQDDTVPLQDYRQIQPNLSSPHGVIVMESGGHGPFFGPTAEEYRNTVKDFMERALSMSPV